MDYELDEDGDDFACPECGGTGVKRGRDCPECDGTGVAP